MAIKQRIPISLKRQCAKALNRVQAEELDRDEAEQIIKKTVDYSPRLRDDLVLSLTVNYDKSIAETLRYFKLI